MKTVKELVDIRNGLKQYMFYVLTRGNGKWNVWCQMSGGMVEAMQEIELRFKNMDDRDWLIDGFIEANDVTDKRVTIDFEKTLMIEI